MVPRNSEGERHKKTPYAWNPLFAHERMQMHMRYADTIHVAPPIKHHADV